MAAAQVLARPGWAGSGVTVEPWWRQAVMVEIWPAAPGRPSERGSPLREMRSQLDSLRSFGVDAVLLRRGAAGTRPAVAAAGGNDAGPVASDPVPSGPVASSLVASSLVVPGLGTTDDFDALLGEASRRDIRILVELQGGGSAAATGAEARAWLNRGVAGLYLPGADPASVAAAQGALRSSAGSRLLITDAPGGDGRSGSRSGTGLVLTPLAGLGQQGNAAQLRASIDGLSGHGDGSDLLAVEPPETGALLRVKAAAVLLSAPGAALLESSWLAGLGDSKTAAAEFDEHSAAAQLRRMSALHRQMGVRSGAATTLPSTGEGAVVWVRRLGGRTVVVACNLTGKPVTLSIRDPLLRMHLRGSFLRTISRSDQGMGAMPLSQLFLPAAGVYLGELSR